MARAATFQPDWHSSPGDTISEILAERSQPLSDFARKMGTPLTHAQELVQGAVKIDQKIAKRLEHVLGPSATFWLSREQQYRADFERIHSSIEPLSDNDWLAKLPLRDMRKFGWIEPAVSRADKLVACLRFFAVPDVHTWQQKYRGEISVASFRTTPTFSSNPFAVTTWLKWAEIESARISCQPWNLLRFKSKLHDIRAFSRIKDPSRFLPEIVQMCADCGVALVIARTPTGCRASGATRFLTPDKALLVLSFRYLSDDHFWFTFFHEAGHLVLHAKEAIFLVDDSDVTSDEEVEANEFAARMLIPAEFVPELLNLRLRVKEIVRFSRKLGISPGIVVGQLQNLGRINRGRLNGLKRHYRWKSSSTVQISP